MIATLYPKPRRGGKGRRSERPDQRDHKARDHARKDVEGNADLQEVTIELGSCHDKSPVLVPFEDEVTMYDLDMADLSWTRSSAVLSCHMVEVNKEHANTKLLGDVQYERRHVE